MQGLDSRVVLVVYQYNKLAGTNSCRKSPQGPLAPLTTSKGVVLLFGEDYNQKLISVNEKSDPW